MDRWQGPLHKTMDTTEERGDLLAQWLLFEAVHFQSGSDAMDFNRVETLLWPRSMIRDPLTRHIVICSLIAGRGKGPLDDSLSLIHSFIRQLFLDELFIAWRLKRVCGGDGWPLWRHLNGPRRRRKRTILPPRILLEDRFGDACNCPMCLIYCIYRPRQR